MLFSALALYHLRVVERIWGSRKFAVGDLASWTALSNDSQSFIVVSLLYSLVITPSLTGLLRLLGLAKHTYVPAGPTPLLFAILAQYHAAVPYLYRFNVGALSGSEANSHSGTIALTSKSTSYILPLQLALSQFPYALAPALVGWIVGYGYRWELLPGSLWRVPGLVVGQSTRLGMSTAESRRVLDETSARSSGADAGHAAAVRRGGLSR